MKTLKEFCQLILKRKKRKRIKIDKETNLLTPIEAVIINNESVFFLSDTFSSLFDLPFFYTDDERKSIIEESKKRFLRSLSLITKKQLILIYKFRDALSKSIIKHLTKVFSETTSAISNYISILFSINNFIIIS
ncbi:MAG: hypothetical protein PHE13_01060 [Bacteroidales bacterium]|nr:hypothetical protein [Bacteroidales bacterium]